MSLLGAMNTAISGLTAQSAAFGNISDNVANSQTVGYKEVNTNFVDYLTTSNATTNDPGAVVAQPAYANNVQGTITQVNNPLALAIAGQGFFAVSQSDRDGQQRPDVQSAAVLHACRRLPAQQHRLPGQQCRRIPERLVGRSHDRNRQPEQPGADSGDPDGIQPGSDRQRDAVRQPAGHADRRHGCAGHADHRRLADHVGPRPCMTRSARRTSSRCNGC